MASRVAGQPIPLPSGVEFKLEDGIVNVKGPKGNLQFRMPSSVSLFENDNVLTFAPKDDAKSSNALAGTSRALINNMVQGVSVGYEKKLTLVGVGYRAQLKGSSLNLTLGFSHPVLHEIPEGITIECPTQTEVIVKGCDKQRVGQVAAEIRAYRPPEPYKGKGVRYSDEVIMLKETKK